MGARPEDYEMSSPQKSYIHVDEFKDAKELADYLHLLDGNDGIAPFNTFLINSINFILILELYNSYFKWKNTGEFINTYFW